MPSTTSQKVRRNGNLAEDAIDPYELVRRLSVIQAEETVKELERKRTDWETQLLESRGDGQAKGHKRTQSGSSVKPFKVHKRSSSVSLAPNQLPPPAYTDLPAAKREQSLPSINRPQPQQQQPPQQQPQQQYASSGRRPSVKRGDSGLDLGQSARIRPLTI